MLALYRTRFTLGRMRQARLKAPKYHPIAYYHCVSRVVDRAFRLQETEREMFVGFMRMYEKLCQVRVVTFCVLSNHFHVLVEVPRRPEVLPTEEEVLGIVAAAFGRNVAHSVRAEVAHFHQIGAHEEARKIIDSFTARMWDISFFMKSLKQRFTQWFNKKHERKGTLWEERYKSTLVEGKRSTSGDGGGVCGFESRAGEARDGPEGLPVVRVCAGGGWGEDGTSRDRGGHAGAVGGIEAGGWVSGALSAIVV
ncbi:MAG: transposase [Verrucomicrobiaceae bacterium]|nr:transposase [Verrucomicrobiaceae bacterium]